MTQPNDAFRLGHEMSAERQNIGSNPYVRGTGSWSEWRRGWRKRNDMPQHGDRRNYRRITEEAIDA